MTVETDQRVVRAYLRAVVGSPLRRSESTETLEAEFVKSASRWAKRTGVDRSTLRKLGVPSRVLDEAGVVATPAGDLIRRHYSRKDFTVMQLASEACISAATVRTTIGTDESRGLLVRGSKSGRAHTWRRA